MKTYTLKELIDGCPEFLVDQRRRYDEYMRTSSWRKRKYKTHRRDGYKCVVCGDSKRLETHHLTYERIFVEKVRDLVTLCPTHHRMVHERAKKQIESSNPNWPSDGLASSPGQVDEEPCMNVLPTSEIGEQR
jgi:hypothetical protein